jgi:tRNA(fMet)-specific endonuclease VapC
MIVLDTDHLTVLKYSDSREYGVLSARMVRSGEDRFFISVVSVEEQLRGWFAKIREFPQAHRQIPGYAGLISFLQYIQGFPILTFDEHAADEFELLRKQKIRVGTMDLKIASIALAHDALLLSRNLRDFRRVPRLRVENWLGEAPPSPS